MSKLHINILKQRIRWHTVTALEFFHVINFILFNMPYAQIV
jgi:hypothetical protein